MNDIISVIIPTYNRAKSIVRAIESVLEQTYTNLQIIVVDDASTDETEAVVKNLRDARIEFIRHAVNKGAAAARNTGIQKAKGKYIAFQDSDDEWFPKKIDQQISIFSNMADVHVVYTDMIVVRPSGSRTCKIAPDVLRGMVVNMRTLEYQVYGIGIQTALIKRECFDDGNHFDESLPRYIDLDLFVRLAKKYNFFHLKIPLVRYFKTDGITSNRAALIEAELSVLKKYNSDIEKNPKFMSRRYFKIGDTLLLDGRNVEGKRYISQAVKMRPLNIKYIIANVLAKIGLYVFVRMFYTNLKLTTNFLIGKTVQRDA